MNLLNLKVRLSHECNGEFNWKWLPPALQVLSDQSPFHGRVGPAN
jgi:hypothetical protein